jgi:spermidine synthase
VQNEDGRVFLRRTQQKYDVILMDAYTASRYGSSIPYSLVTQDFFKLANEHLTTNGVIAYNVIGTANSPQINIVSAIYKTLAAVFPRVYYFPATSSRNVVLVATKSPQFLTPALLNQTWAKLAQQGWNTLPTLHTRLRNFQTQAPPSAGRAKVLTDNFAPVDGLLTVE